MKAEGSNSTVPPQHEGAQKDIVHALEAADENGARKLFLMARNRLVDVNHWHECAGAMSARFRLTNAHGLEVDRTAEKNDHFKINIPAPGPAEGSGYDWVRIEAIEDKSDSHGKVECFAMRVRPSSDPTEKGDNVAHFFKDESTSSFVVERNGTKVVAAVYGRNEVPNTDTTNIIDKVRNAVVGVTAIAGLANIQWGNLVRGLLRAG